MNIYLVGGAVRDKLLSLPVKDRDWVVTGATADAMRELGYQQVGNAFPVFLHPTSKEEYALARTERKTGSGYTGFTVDSSADISLEDDLRRRDLTINAIAEDDNGQLIDPFGGQQDLEQRCLRHVSDAFIEDPVRLLRVARFAAQLDAFGFTIAPETEQLLNAMVDNGEVDHLVPERVWQELHKALQSSAPSRFFQILQACGALSRLVPELNSNDYAQQLSALSIATSISNAPLPRFAAWAAAATNTDIWLPRLRTPKDYSQLALLLQQHKDFFADCIQLPPEKVLAGLKSLDALRRPQRFAEFLIAAEAVFRASSEQQQPSYPQRDYLFAAAHSAAAISAKALTQHGLSGPELAAELDRQRCIAIRKLKA